tara:strand:- start:82 stop:1065 length:984 start_codon:yes stop_codon:yes gene_type:complete
MALAPSSTSFVPQLATDRSNWVSNRISKRHFLAIITVMFLWAICYPLIVLGLSEAPHLSFATLRAVLAGAALLLIALALRRPMPRGWRVWASLAAIGLGATTLGFIGMFHAAEFVSPGLATVISNTQPIMAAVLAHFFLSEHLDVRGKIGLSLAFFGIVLIAVPQLTSSAASNYSIGIAYISLAAIGITFSNIEIRRTANTLDPLVAMGWQLVLGSIPLAVIALATEQPTTINWTGQFVFSLLSLSLLGTALVYWLWCKVLQKVELNRANAFSFLIPVFGLAMGVGFYQERLGWIEIGGVTLALVGIILVNRPRAIKMQLARPYPRE